MLYVIKFLYTTFLLPPGVLVVAMAMLSVWLWRRQKQAGRVLAAFTVLFYLGTTALVGDTVIRSLESKYYPPTNPKGDVIVLLGGGATLDTPNVHGYGHLSGYAANRLLTAAQLYKELKVPIIVSGGKVLVTTGCEAEISRNILIGLGVPEDKILLDDKSLNTTENAIFTKRVMAEHGLRQPILVTSAFHMARAVLQFRKVQVEVLPYPSDYQVNLKQRFALYQLWPTASALENISLALKEYAGILAVKWY